MKVEADLDLCQAHQNCQLDAPDIFGFDDATDKVVVVLPHPPDELRADAVRAVKGCPAMALTIAADHPVDPVEED